MDKFFYRKPLHVRLLWKTHRGGRRFMISCDVDKNKSHLKHIYIYYTAFLSVFFTWHALPSWFTSAKSHTSSIHTCVRYVHEWNGSRSLNYFHLWMFQSTREYKYLQIHLCNILLLTAKEKSYTCNFYCQGKQFTNCNNTQTLTLCMFISKTMPPPHVSLSFICMLI